MSPPAVCVLHVCVQTQTFVWAVRLVGESRPEYVGGVQGHHTGLEQAGLWLLWGGGGEGQGWCCECVW